jgi:hypothetical protein
MPYFVYKIYPNTRLVPVQPFDSFRDAQALAKSMRASMPPDDPCTVKVIFAETPEAAERLLLEKREYIPREDD